MKIRTFHIILIAVIAALAGYYIGVSRISFDWNNFKPRIAIASKEPPTSLSNVDFSLFWTAWDTIVQKYYDKTAIDPQKLLDGAVSGMVQSIGDPYTVYLPPVKNDDFKQQLAGQFEGIGAELGLKDKQIVVIAPLDGSPAQRSGVKAGDAILKINNQSTTNLTLVQAVEKIRGPKGTTVALTLLHKDEKKSKDIMIKRDTINIKSTDGYIKKISDIAHIKVQKNANNSIMYLRLSQFGDNTNQEWLTLINKLSLDAKNDKQMKGIVLDLRDNPGGYLTDAVFIASEFLQNGVVVIQDKGNNNQEPLSVSRRGLLVDYPLVVLINKGSASASEIVSGALRDHKRATLIGETSFGKGTIQQAEDLGNGAGLHITVAKWLTPNGTWVHGKGLTPDVSVQLDKNDQTHDTQLEKAIEYLVK